MRITLRALLLSVLLVDAMVAGRSAGAQSVRTLPAPLVTAVPGTVGGLDVTTERARIASERVALEQRVAAERAACYQQFAVQDCLIESQRRKRTETDHLKRQEAQLSDAERKRRGALELDRLEAQQKQRSAAQVTEQETRARQAQQQREHRASEVDASRASAMAAAPGKKLQLESKQRASSRKQADQANRAAAAPRERERFERKRQQSAEHQSTLDRKNGQRTKPRSAGLPPP